MDIKEKVKLVTDLCHKHDITAYELGKIEGITTTAARKIIEGITKKPRDKTLEIILDYIENKIVGSTIPGHKNYNPKAIISPEVKETASTYIRPDMNILYKALQEMGRDLKKGQALMSEAIAQTLLNTDELIDYNSAHKKSLNKLNTILSNKGITSS